MCFACEDGGELDCSFCGVACHGLCDDPDRCPSCWYEEFFDEYDDETCEGLECSCECHEIMAQIIAETHDPCPHKPIVATMPGVFPFLELPGELRDKIYHHSLTRYQGDRSSSFFRGTIYTALLSTCRQINREARHLPLSLNTFCFVDPLYAVRFIGFGLAPAQRQLVKSIQVDITGMGEFHELFSACLVPQLMKMSLNHLSITIKGRLGEEWFTKAKCLETSLSRVKGLTSFDLVIGSGIIEAKVKSRIVGAIRKKLVETTQPVQNPLKRKADPDTPIEDVECSVRPGKKPAKRPSGKKAAARKSKDIKQVVPEQAVQRDPELVSALMIKHDLLKDYAHAYDSDAASVKIRLGRALEAAREGNDVEFEKLAEDILATLEAHYARITTSRGLVPYSLATPSH